MTTHLTICVNDANNKCNNLYARGDITDDVNAETTLYAVKDTENDAVLSNIKVHKSNASKTETSKIRCSMCKQYGHNKRYCKNTITQNPAQVKITTQSNELSRRLSKLVEDGRRLNDDSYSSEKILLEALHEIKPYIEKKCKLIGGIVEHKKSISLFECQTYFNKCGGPIPNEENKNVSMKPDGGIFIMILNGDTIPLLIIEDKVQGTNDNLYEQRKKRQSTGNAIERGAKNIRGAEMLFANQNIFPYVMFVSGCDFHSSETIAKRIEMMNMGFPNHYIDITPTTSSEEIRTKINTIIPCINIEKKCGKSIASVFVKAHKWDEMKHGSSYWKKEEIVTICKNVIDQVFNSLVFNSLIFNSFN